MDDMTIGRHNRASAFSADNGGQSNNHGGGKQQRSHRERTFMRVLDRTSFPA
jgi:hypothetical protein